MKFPYGFLVHILAVLYGDSTLHKKNCVFKTIQIKKKKILQIYKHDRSPLK